MESYYDSDEEIAWGPLTLREIKSDFKRPVLRLPNRRHTTLGSFQMDSSFTDSDMPESHSEDSAALSQDIANKLNVSETPTEYYSPNESLRTEQNSGFLEKLSRVINDPQTELSEYTSALENTKVSVITEAQTKNESFKSALSQEYSNSSHLSLVNNRNNAEDSCLNFLKVAAGHTTICDIANFHQSLVENTVSLSDDERVIAGELDYLDSEESLHEELKYESRHTLVQKKMLSPEAEEIFVISDDEESLSNTSVVSDEENCKTFLIKKETSYQNDMYDKKCDVMKVEEGNVDYRRGNCGVSYEKNQHEDKSTCDSGKSGAGSQSQSEEKSFLNASSITIPEIDLTQFDDSVSQIDSPQFDDTLEEMNRLLNQGNKDNVPLIEERKKLTTLPFIIPKIIVTRFDKSISKVDDTLDDCIEISEETPNKNAQYNLADSTISEIVEIKPLDSNSKTDSVELNDDCEILEERQCCGSTRSSSVDNKIPQIYPTIEGQEVLTISLTTIAPETITTKCHDLISKNGSLELVDAIEEMNGTLKQGLDYTMSEGDSIIEGTPVRRGPEPKDIKTEPTCNIISGSFLQKPSDHTFLRRKEKKNKIPVRKFQQSVTPDSGQHNTYTLIKSSPNTNFKVPITPVRTKHANPTPPKSSSSHLKNIVSPVALYIKNSPNVPLKQNVPQRGLPKIVTTKIVKPSSKENYPQLPEIVYKPSKKQITSKEKEITLPPSFKKLNIKEPVIVKHEGRINHNTNKSVVNRKLLQSDITNNSIDASVLNNSNDISVLTNKQAYIK